MRLATNNLASQELSVKGISVLAAKEDIVTLAIEKSRSHSKSPCDCLK
jgi:hypothetical protein